MDEREGLIVILGKILGFVVEYDGGEEFTIGFYLECDNSTYKNAWQVPPVAAKALFESLKKAIEKYESVRGEIEIKDLKV